MAIHHGGKVGAAASRLADSRTSKAAKSKAGRALSSHRQAYHSKRSR